MAMNLNAQDLSVATAYRTSVHNQLLQVLNETKAGCALVSGGGGNQWSHGRLNPGPYLIYTSPWVDDQEDVYVEFGFDFDRKDVSWNVVELRLPSAYFAVRGTHRTELDQLVGWDRPPSSWGEDYLLVKQLDCLRVGGESLHAMYVEFLRDAREELWRTINR